jgi:phosphatidylserine/phosphatidylglycerophosphate/cardiolipin synthase-like enzyme/DNA/RNA endonuclease YhcR with UshA esterase domain
MKVSMNSIKKCLVLVVLQCLSVAVFGQVIKIRDARLRDTGTVVTVQGIVTNGTELGQTIRFFQDSTAALSAYYAVTALPTFGNVKRGDSLEVTGKLKLFNGLLEIDPIQNFRIINSNNTSPTPLVIGSAGMVEANEAKLVKLNGGTFVTPATSFAGNTNYVYSVGGQNVQVRIQTGSALIGKLIPSGVINLTGLVSDFRGTYQLLPRDSADIEFTRLELSQELKQTNITTTSFNVSWGTSGNAPTRLVYGTSANNLTSVSGAPTAVTAHNVALSGLTPATVYYVSAQLISGVDTIKTDTIAMSTVSLSTGVIQVYFNRGVDTTFSTGGRAAAVTGQRCENEIARRISLAKSTVDVAMYSSGSTNIKNALTQAAARGVRVRYIADRRALNVIYTDTASLGFKFIKRPSTELMHNKFFVIDADSVNSSWVIMGAMNNSIDQIYVDPNNMLMIQDQSLARAYTLEFAEMWGSNTAFPNVAAGKFGGAKTKNTPKDFLIGGKKTELYFSPKGDASKAILDVINSANTDLEVALLILTYFDFGTAISNAQRRNVAVRGLLNSDTAFASSQYNFLTRNGVDFRLYNAGGDIFHHKYVIADAKAPNSDPTLATGSHNWTNAAENDNDENLLVIHDATVANIFLQEFEQRWKEVRIQTGSAEVQNAAMNLNISPNPSSDWLHVELDMSSEKNSDLNLIIFNLQGQMMEAHVEKAVQGKFSTNISLATLPTGTYILAVKSAEGWVSKKIQIVK